MLILLTRGGGVQNLGKPADVILERSLIGNMQGSNTPCLWPIESFWLMKISHRMFSKKSLLVKIGSENSLSKRMFF